VCVCVCGGGGRAITTGQQLVVSATHCKQDLVDLLLTSDRIP
jgi:hypothetical protein